MKEFNSCISAMEYSITNQYFAIAHLYHNEKTLHMHIHDCYEIYFSISGGKQFLIDNQFYIIQPGDIFFINQYESHHVAQIDEAIHERIVLSISPSLLTSLSTSSTDLHHCFARGENKCHRLSLGTDSQKRFLYFIHKIKSASGFGEDLCERAAFVELMVFLSRAYLENQAQPGKIGFLSYHHQIDDIITYINNHLQDSLTIHELSKQFFLSDSYLCRIFKETTGTTINKYISAQRISIAKSFLSQGHTVSETCELCGFRDYSNFLKTFTKIVGISPKKYAKFI